VTFYSDTWRLRDWLFFGGCSAVIVGLFILGQWSL